MPGEVQQSPGPQHPADLGERAPGPARAPLFPQPKQPRPPSATALAAGPGVMRMHTGLPIGGVLGLVRGVPVGGLFAADEIGVGVAGMGQLKG